MIKFLKKHFSFSFLGISLPSSLEYIFSLVEMIEMIYSQLNEAM